MSTRLTEPAAILRDVRRRRNRQMLVSLPAAAVALFFIVVRQNPAGLVAVVPVVLFALWNWRCPACNTYLGKPTWPSFCHNCGVPLKESTR